MAEIPMGLRKPGEIDQATAQALKARAREDLYFMAKGILGYKDLTPRVHSGLADFMRNGGNRQLILMPRGHFKTTLSLAELIWTAAFFPEERTLLCCEAAENAEYMLNEVKSHLTDNQLLRIVFPDLIPENFNTLTWNKKHIVLKRKGSYREPTIDTGGITTKLVSRHYTRIVCDDLVSDEAMYSQTVMKKACDFVNRLISLTVNPSKDLIRVIGTRWAFNDVYSHIMDRFPDFKMFRRKAIIKDPETGEPVPLFPERFTMDMFQQIIKNDPEQWATQYSNDPLDLQAMDFKPEWLQYCVVPQGRAVAWVENDITHVIPFHDLNFYIHIDPSVGESPESDYTGIIVVAVDEHKRAFVLDAVAHRLDPVETAERIVALSRIYEPKKVTVEDNAYQKSLVYYVKDLASRMSTYVPIEGVTASSRKTKPARIRGALRPQFSTGMIWIREGLTDLVDEYLRFGRTAHEHLLDALAQGPAVWRPALSVEKRQHLRRKTIRAKRNLGLTGYGA